jgi:hypothetical protein
MDPRKRFRPKSESPPADTEPLLFTITPQYSRAEVSGVTGPAMASAGMGTPTVGLRDPFAPSDADTASSPEGACTF